MRRKFLDPLSKLLSPCFLLGLGIIVLLQMGLLMDRLVLMVLGILGLLQMGLLLVLSLMIGLLPQMRQIVEVVRQTVVEEFQVVVVDLQVVVIDLQVVVEKLLVVDLLGLLKRAKRLVSLENIITHVVSGLVYLLLREEQRANLDDQQAIWLNKGISTLKLQLLTFQFVVGVYLLPIVDFFRNGLERVQKVLAL